MAWIKKLLPWFFVLLLCLPVLAGTVTLSWDPSPSDIDGYDIYWYQDNESFPYEGEDSFYWNTPIRIDNVLTYQFNDLETTVYEYLFAVKAYKGNDESVFSNVVRSELKELQTLPSVPTNFRWSPR
jgi:hypothetical protein